MMENIQWAIDHGRHEPKGNPVVYNRARNTRTRPLYLCPVCEKVWDWSKTIMRKKKPFKSSLHYIGHPKYGLDKKKCSDC